MSTEAPNPPAPPKEQAVEYDVQILGKVNTVQAAKLMAEGFELYPCIVLRRAKTKTSPVLLAKEGDPERIARGLGKVLG